MKPRIEKAVSFGDFIRQKILLYVASISIAVISVFFTLVPYFTVYKILTESAVKALTMRSLAVYAFIIIASFFLSLLMYGISTAISHKTAFFLLGKIRLAVTEKMMKMPLGFTQVKGAGYFHSMLIDSIERLEYPLAHALPETTSNVLLPLSIIAFLFFADWRMALAVLIPATVTLSFYFPMYFGIMDEFARTYYAALSNMNSRVIEYIKGNKEIKIFGNETEMYSKYTEAIDNYQNSTLRLYNKMYFVTAPAFVLLSSITVSVLITGGFLYTAGTLHANMYLFTVIISLGIGSTLLKFTEFMDNFYHIQNGKRLIAEVLSAPELEEPALCNLPDQNCSKHILKNEIVFSGVSFGYDEKQVLHNVSFTFRENKKTAIVGISGSGKTTIANVAARFWDITSGSITLDGVEYKNIPLKTLMEKITYVTQDTFLFNMTIMENIRMGKPDASDAEVMEAARLAQCADFIGELENGYQTCAGDDGAKLSNGQRQRIIIARALLRNTPILILDEATAYTDMENQHKIQQSLQELCKNKTVIIIAHRLSTVAECDSIIVMENGSVHAQGTHKELLEKSPLYQTLWSAQMEEGVSLCLRQ
ncbi:ABC transporter ATP-binding protein [Treponema pedis]|uniref:ABC transporter ATP-binding protein n=1 Tax=Treponema pedis TaxID=409322 RepID=A0A7S7AWL9_9SPIR|nr:ABC transporter ATP-binding protein [Treponema pedis]QOW60756.1 ABC transporter ATP-binding protein [Treponema pedis]